MQSYKNVNANSFSFSQFVNDLASSRCEKLKYCTIIVRSDFEAMPVLLRESLSIPASKRDVSYGEEIGEYTLRKLSNSFKNGWYEPPVWNTSLGKYNSDNYGLYPDIGWYNSDSNDIEYRAYIKFCPDDNSITVSSIKKLIEPIISDIPGVEIVNVKIITCTPRQLRKKPPKPSYEGVKDSLGVVLEKGDIAAYSRILGKKAVTRLGTVSSWTKSFVTMEEGDKSPIDKVIIIKSYSSKELKVDDMFNDASKYLDIGYFN